MEAVLQGQVPLHDDHCEHGFWEMVVSCRDNPHGFGSGGCSAAVSPLPSQTLAPRSHCWHCASPCLPPARSLTQSLTTLWISQSPSSAAEAMPSILRVKQGMVNAFRNEPCGWAGLCKATVPPCPTSLLLMQHGKAQECPDVIPGGACLCFQLC